MRRQFTLPDVGEGLLDATVVAWHVAVGDEVELNQELVDVETAKAIVTLPSPFAGTVAQLHAAEGETLDVGSTLITLESRGAESDSPEAEPAAGPPPRPTVLVGYGPQTSSAQRRPRKPDWQPGGNGQPGRDGPAGPPAGEPGHRRAAPPVRQLARRLGVDLSSVDPSGDDGEITRRDVESAASAAQGPMESRRLAATPVRKATAAAMVASAFTAPHVTEWVVVDVTRSMRLARRLKEHPEYAGIRVSPLLLVARATLLAVTRYPEVNASWDSSSDEIILHGDVNLGIAVASPRGLLVPNIKAAQRLSTPELGRRMQSLVDTARDGSTPLADLRGGTFTITNIGTFGVDGGTPILNPGEAGIVCVGRVHRQPWEHKGRIKLRDVSTISFSFDHRLVDGELGSRILSSIAEVLEHPDLALGR